MYKRFKRFEGDIKVKKDDMQEMRDEDRKIDALQCAGVKKIGRVGKRVGRRIGSRKIRRKENKEEKEKRGGGELRSRWVG